MLKLKVVVSLILGMLTAAEAVDAAKWPKIPRSDRELNRVVAFPNAAAVILLREGNVRFSKDSKSSFIDVYTRIKVLTAEGTEFGTISLVSSDLLRTKNIEGRTHLPDGSVVELTKDATFEKEYSDFYGTTLASVALPQVVPGAIIEYRYRRYFDYILFTNPWYFQAEIPTLTSRVIFNLPETVRFHPVEIPTLRSVELQRDVKNTPFGNQITYTMENVPPVPDEPYRFPFEDLSSRVVVLPGTDYGSGTPFPIFETWDSVVELAVGNDDYGYVKFRRKSRDARAEARRVSSGIGGYLERAQAIYRWVRDEIDLGPYVGVWVGKKTADSVLENHSAGVADKALLLEVMLREVGIKTAIAWSNPRGDGRINTNIPNPSQLGSVLVVATIAGQEFFLDPSDRRLAFGQLSPGVRGMPCLVVRKRKHAWDETPPLDPAESQRQAEVKLNVDDQGVATGAGTFSLTGYHAWERLRWKDTKDNTDHAWAAWIEARYPGYDVSGVEVEEDVEASRIDVRWVMAQREDEALGDETSISVAAPLAVATNPFTLAPNQRLTPVQFDYCDIDRLRLTVSWPEGWIVDGAPRLANLTNSAGSLVTSFSEDPEERRLTIERTLTISQNEFIGRGPYAELRNLFAATVANDGEQVLLVAE